MDTIGQGCNVPQYTYPVVMVAATTTSSAAITPPSWRNERCAIPSLVIDRYSGKKHIGSCK